MRVGGAAQVMLVGRPNWQAAGRTQETHGAASALQATSAAHWASKRGWAR